MTDDKPKLLIVEDDVGLQKQLKWCFDEHEVLIAASRTEAIAQLRRFEPPVVLQDLGLPPDAEGVDEGMATLREILSLAPRTKVIVVTGNHDRDNAVRAVSLGAYDFYQKPVDTDVLRLIVSRAFHIHALEEQNRALREAQLHSPFEGLIATDDAMRKVCRMVEKVAPADVSVLILGESGTGKELVARAVHSCSNRKAGRFVAINCAA
ncbi:MAG: sigma 54-interacting transcriptional regulator, partial [Steroidobacter sp.]